jgi:hypothetical protein
MARVASADDVVLGVEQAVCDGLDQLLRATGAVQPPMVHMFAAGQDPAYVGCVTCRPFYAGDDAHRAVAGLGDLPAAVEATRLLVTWEAQDLNVALGAPVDPDGSALIVLDATLGGEVLRIYPLRLRRARRNQPALIPDWLPPRTVADPALPAPITRLLVVWRMARGTADLAGRLRDLESAGYRVGLFGR